MDAGRQQRGMVIAATLKIVQKGNIWVVPSQAGNGAKYSVRPDKGTPWCSCPDHESHGKECKHIIAVQIVIQRELFDDGTETVTKQVTVVEKVQRKTYPQDWPNYNRAQVNEHRHFHELLADLCNSVPTPVSEPKRGRPAIASSDSAFCAILKVYSTMSARRFMGDLAEAKEAGRIGRVPHFNSVLNFFDTDVATEILMDFVAKSAAPLAEVESDFAVDSTGFSGATYLQWIDEKYGTPKRQATWIKLHAIVGVKTNVVASVTILEKCSFDGKQLPALVKEASKQFDIKEVSADKAYTSNPNFDAVEGIGAKFYPAFKKGSTGGVGGSYAKALHLMALNKEEYDRHYHKRSNVESTFSAVKRKVGGSLRSKTERAMKNEALAKIVVYNITCVIAEMYALGIDPTMGCTKNREAAQILAFKTA